MMVDCKTISGELREIIRNRVLSSRAEIRLAIIKAAHGDPLKDAQTEAFLKQKRACGKEVGIDVREYDVSDYLESQKKLEERVSEIARIPENSAVIVQLPLPHIRNPNKVLLKSDFNRTINTQAVLNSIPPKKDADVLHAESFGRYEAGSTTALVPPVVGAMEEILRREAPDIFQNLERKTVVVIGQGLVIGKQVNRWAIRNNVLMFSGLREGSDIARYTREADIIVSGTGNTRLIVPDMVKEGTIIFDFGFSKENGVVRGDVDATVADKARLLTPVPGGMGPLAVTMLFWNLARIRGVID
jgi:methylenetetrahydrofolate dehydrogenase (NADP+) / methenyltetrahydrofolate cyclohydrolase